TLAELGMLKGAEILEGSGVRVRVELPTPASPWKARLEEVIRSTLQPLKLARVEVAFDWSVRGSPAKAANANDLIPSVRNVILIGSGKGGVGTSTVSANGAGALARPGAKGGPLAG